MHKTISLAPFFVVIAALLLASCGDPTNKQDTIKVGLIIELTGDMPAVGASSRNAAELAVSEMNSAGGIAISGKSYQVELIIEDNASKADQSVAAANKLISQDNVVAIVGPNASLGAIPAAEIAEYNKTLLVTPWSTNPKTTLDTTSG